MPDAVRTFLCGLALCATALLGAGPAAAGECKATFAGILKAGSPNGYAVFRRVRDKTFFRTWLDCEDAQFGLPTAVHESVHMITGEIDAYPLVGGGEIKRPPEDKALFAPARIERHFQPGSLFVSTYLHRGSATSAMDFRYLLDELNAYTHDLDTAMALDHMRDPNVQPAHRDGLAALMSFVALYVEAAEANPVARSALHRPEMMGAISTLWDQAERTMVASCRIPDIGTEDREFLVKLCGSGPQASLGRLLGRPAICPKACLTSGQRTASRD